MKKAQLKTLATGTTLEALTKRISDYYYGATITLTPERDYFIVSNAKGPIVGHRVLKHLNGFKFVRCC